MGNFNELDERYQDIINQREELESTTRDELLKNFIKYQPKMTSDEISKNREACIKVLEQDLEIEDELDYLIDTCEEIEKLKAEINVKPKFEYPDFVKEPVPKKPQKKIYERYQFFGGYGFFKYPSFWKVLFSIIGFFAVSFGIFLVAGLILHTTSLSENILFAINNTKVSMSDAISIGIGLLVGGLIINKGSRAFFVTIILPFRIILCTILNLFGKIKTNKENKQAELKYNYQQQEIEKRNKENYQKYCEERDKELSKYEQIWEQRLKLLPKMAENLDTCFKLSKKALNLLRDIYDNVQKKIFDGAKDFNSYEDKENIISCLKNYQATTYSEAINFIIDDARRKDAELKIQLFRAEQLKQQRLHDEEVRKIERDKIEAQRRHNEEMLRLQKQQMDNEEKARLRAEEIAKERAQKEADDRADIIKQMQQRNETLKYIEEKVDYIEREID